MINNIMILNQDRYDKIRLSNDKFHSVLLQLDYLIITSDDNMTFKYGKSRALEVTPDMEFPYEHLQAHLVLLEKIQRK